MTKILAVLTCSAWSLFGTAILDVTDRLENVSTDFSQFPAQILIYGDDSGESVRFRYKVYVDPDGKVRILGFRSFGRETAWTPMPQRGTCSCSPVAHCDWNGLLP